MKQKEEDAINAADGDGGRATAVSDSPRSCASIDYDGIDNWQMSGAEAAAAGTKCHGRGRRTDGRRVSGSRARAWGSLKSRKTRQIPTKCRCLKYEVFAWAEFLSYFSLSAMQASMRSDWS